MRRNKVLKAAVRKRLKIIYAVRRGRPRTPPGGQANKQMEARTVRTLTGYAEKKRPIGKKTIGPSRSILEGSTAAHKLLAIEICKMSLCCSATPTLRRVRCTDYQLRIELVVCTFDLSCYTICHQTVAFAIGMKMVFVVA